MSLGMWAYLEYLLSYALLRTLQWLSATILSMVFEAVTSFGILLFVLQWKLGKGWYKRSVIKDKGKDVLTSFIISARVYLALLGLVFFAAIFSVAYHDHADLVESNRKLKESITEIESERDKERETRKHRIDVINQLARFIVEGEQLRGRCIQEQGSPAVEVAFNEWFNRCITYIGSSAMGSAYAARFYNMSDKAYHDAPMNYPINRGSIYNSIRGRVERLSELIKEWQSLVDSER